MNIEKLKNVVEGFLFASDKPLTVDKIIKLFPDDEQPEKESVIECINTLMVDFESHGIELKQVKSGYRFQVRQENASWVAKLWDERPAKYTRAMLETLALIVYRQPITRGEIEAIRGVAVSSHTIRTMMDRDWVKVIGHRDVPGRPALYASTKTFLDYFNLTSLEDLPPLSEIKDLDAIATELDPEQNSALISAIREMQKDNTEADSDKPIEGEVEVESEQDAQIIITNHDLEEHTEKELDAEAENEAASEIESETVQKTFGDLISNFGKPNSGDAENELSDIDEENKQTNSLESNT